MLIGQNQVDESGDCWTRRLISPQLETCFLSLLHFPASCSSSSPQGEIWLLSSLIILIIIRIEEMLQAVPPPWPARLVWSQELEQRFPWLAGQQPGALEVSLYFHSAQLVAEFSNLTTISKIIFSEKGFDGWLECFKSVGGQWHFHSAELNQSLNYCPTCLKHPK